MKYCRYILLFFALLNIVSASAQVKYGIQKAYAFRTVSAPGNISTGDDNGKVLQTPKNVKFTLFVETKGTSPIWQKAIIGGKTFTIYVQPIKKMPFNAGVKMKDEKKVMINISRGNKLWQIDLTSLSSIPAEQQILASDITLSGTFRSKHVTYKIKNIVDLKSPEYY